MTTGGLGVLRSRLYEAYACQYFGRGGDEAALVHRRDTRHLLSTATGPIVDLGRRCIELVLLLEAYGSDADTAAVTGMQLGHIVTHYLPVSARTAAVVAKPAGS